MIYITLALSLLIVVLLAFLYNIWKEDLKKPSILDVQLPAEKSWYLDESLFRNGLSAIEIQQAQVVLLKSELNKSIVWMDDFINAILVNLFAGWHLLVEWLPGLAKTKTIFTLAQALDMSFKRIQFTPDMLPADIIWVEIFDTESSAFKVIQWPVFTNILLADEINRTTPKVQSALLESMQEYKVSIWWKDYLLPEPFFVLATQNPIEQEGTYPLPEAQLDRFMFKVVVDYPTQEQEMQILSLLNSTNVAPTQKVLNIAEFKQLSRSFEEVFIDEKVQNYIVRLVWATRQPNKYIVYGASPRASIALMKASKVLAALQGRNYVTYEDVMSLSLLVLRHRVWFSYDIQIDWVSADDVLVSVLKTVTLW